MWFGHSGSAPSPFNALDGPRLAGPAHSHPLHDVRAEELVEPSDDALDGEIVFDGVARVGEGIAGTVRATARETIDSRSAILRLVGLRLDEVRRSREERDSQGRVTHSEEWVETDGKLFVQDGFREHPIPAQLATGQSFETTFLIPAPTLGPPSAHLGESIIAWAVEARWDVPHGRDHWVAAFLPLKQHPDLIRAGVGRQGGASLLASVDTDGGTISVTSPLPCPAGTDLLIRTTWPSAPDGSAARIEVHRRTNAPNGIEGIIASVAVDPATLPGGADARLSIPTGSAPSFDGAGLEITYVVRVLIDRRFRADAAIERPVAII